MMQHLERAAKRLWLHARAQNRGKTRRLLLQNMRGSVIQL
jgi:hypothetical protein